MKKPNFFIIGAPKCGTTSLAAYLAEHPEIFISNPKEIHYFNRPSYPLAEYEKIFVNAGPQHKAVGEASPSYLYFKQAVPNILDYNPDAKFIVMLRNPIDRLYSGYYQGLRSGKYTINDIRAYWRLLPEDIDSSPHFWDRNIELAPKDRFKHGEQIEQLYNTVSNRDKILTILFDDLKADTKHIYENVLSFLNVSSDNRINFPIHNEGKTVRFSFLNYSLRLMSRTVKKTLRIKPHTSLTKGWIGWIQYDLNSVKIKRPPLPEDFRAELREYFREDVQLLSRLIDRVYLIGNK